ncbi:MAG: DUF58 domain-containing protein [Thiomargarita sp.]|nr:DUF58 domain-containing protein [Thiomargarita sp.]
MSKTLLNDEAVRVSIPALIRLNQAASTLPRWPSARIRAQQSGSFLSSFRGRGMEFDEVRPYQEGDDMRSIDWRVTARTGKVHTKLFHEERERPVFLWVDYRAPMFFATRGVFKSVLAAQAAALLAWHALHHNDRVGGLIFSEETHHELKPQRGKHSVLQFIKQLAQMSHQSSQDNKNAAEYALGRLRHLARPGSLLFLISDFRYWNAKTESHLVHIARHSDVVMLCLHDPLESQLPPAGRYRLSNGIRDTMLNTIDSKKVTQYHQRFKKHQAYLQNLAQQHRILLLSASTTDNPLSVLQKGLGLA